MASYVFNTDFYKIFSKVFSSSVFSNWMLTNWWQSPEYAATAQDGSIVYPSFIADFIKQRYAKRSFLGSVSQSILTSMFNNITRAGSATYYDQYGVLQTAGTNVPRFNYTMRGQQPLRVAGVDCRLLTANETMGVTNQIVRVPYLIGSGDFSELVISAATPTVSSATVEGYTIQSASLEKDGTSLYAPITFNGLRSVTLAAGDYDIQSDAISPAPFGLTKFSRGELYWIRAIITVPTTSGRIPFGGRAIAQRTGTSFTWYNPSTYTITNGVDSTGAITGTGTSYYARSAGWNPILLGRFTSGDPMTVFGCGDSIHFGQGDTTAVPNGYGIFGRSCVDADGVSNARANINFNRIGSSTGDFTTGYPWMRNYMKYCNTLVDNYGTNDLGSGGAGSVATIEANLLLIWGYFKSFNPNGKIIRSYIYPRTSSTDSFTTLSGQTITVNFDVKAPQLNTWFDSKVADGTITAVAGYSTTMTAIASGEPLKWAVNGTANYPTGDGVHPASVMHIARASEIRTILATLSPAFDVVPTTNSEGLLEEGPATNYCNSNLAGVAYPSTAPNLWSYIPLSGMTVVFSNLIYENGIPCFDVSISGTPTVTGDVVLDPINGSTIIAAASGQTWTHSVFLKLISGTLTTGSYIGFSGRDSGGAITEIYTSTMPSLGVNSTLARYKRTNALSNVSTAYIRPQIRIGLSSGTAYNIVLRIGAPQIERNGMTSLILSNGGATTRAQDEFYTTNMEWFNGNEGTLIVKTRVTSAGMTSGWGTSSPNIRGHMSRTTSQAQAFYQGSLANTGPTYTSSASEDATTKVGTLYGSSLIQRIFADGVQGTATTVNIGFPWIPNRFSASYRYFGAGAADWSNKPIEYILYYPKRLLVSEMQRLTTL